MWEVSQVIQKCRHKPTETDGGLLENETPTRYRLETEVRAVLKALSVHGRNGQVHLRDRIVSCYRVALRVHPTVARPVAPDSLQWKRWKFRKQLAYLIKQKIKLPAGDAKLVQQYLVKAEKGLAR